MFIVFVYYNKVVNIVVFVVRMWIIYYLRGSEIFWFRYGDRKVFVERKLSELIRIVEIKFS